MSKNEDKDTTKSMLITVAIFLGVGVLFFHLGTGYWWVVLVLVFIIIGMS